MQELAEKYNELKSIILKSNKFKVREDFHLFILLEEISTKINSFLPDHQKQYRSNTMKD